MIKRIIVSIIALPLVVVLMYFGGWWLAGGIAAVAMLGQIEFYRAFGKLSGWHFAAMAATLGLVSLLMFAENIPIGLYAILVLVALAFCTPLFFVRQNSATTAVFGFFYVTGLIFAVVVMRQQLGLYLAWMIFIAAWGSDTGAYFCGKAFGKRKLVPKLSPNKTVAGSVGGAITAAVLSVTYGVILHHLGIWEFGNLTIGLLSFAAFGLLGAIFAQCGDLAASAIKRHVGIKDFGQLIPGHGGILDRFDSILFVAPFALIYFYNVA
ncbi:MAG: phosphatidate cytidylyltransferase [Defluviitaleaceae bacterium]|nr:phosphatidate cytidylyltransferase [Defluviitaleaceae bacterium]